MSIPYGKHNISKKDIKNVVRVLKSDWLTQGKAIPKFEQALCKYTGSMYATVVNSATSALHVACKALGLKKGSILWTVPNTFVSSANCGLHCGAKVDFVDINYDTKNISISELERKLEVSKKEGSLPDAVVPVAFAGLSCDMQKINFLSKKYNFKIIEDASHALGANYKELPVGSCNWSDVTVFSFHPVKIITSGEGGVAMTNDLNLKFFFSFVIPWFKKSFSFS